VVDDWTKAYFTNTAAATPPPRQKLVSGLTFGHSPRECPNVRPDTSVAPRIAILFMYQRVGRGNIL
jgi:hypothetical protein